MHLLEAGILRDASHPCLACGGPAGTCWCGPTHHEPRHDEGVFAGLLLRARRATFVNARS